jgi:CheY-like chemotaxis protein
MLLNLLTNAVKFTEHGSISVRVTGELLTVPRWCLRFEVQDTGVGLTAEQQSRLFGRFEQAEISTARRYGGTGLGLAICRKLAALWNGQVGVSSEPGRGSNFWFTLEVPAVASAQAAAKAPAVGGEVSSECQGVRVLVVDDNQINRTVAQRMLKRMGCETFLAENGAEALVEWQRLRDEGSPADLILMDCHMPELDGWQTTKRIRDSEKAEGADSAVAILALTASVLDRDRQRSREAGMNGFLAKPIEPAKLQEAVRTWAPQRN